MKKDEVNRFLIGLFLSVLIALPGKSSAGARAIGAHPADDDKPVPYHLTSWMGELGDDKYLSEITIPGTHDTGADLHTSEQGIMSDYVICQDYRLANQLQMGVRWFDIRLRLHNGALTVHHGPYYLHKNFDDMLSPVVDFLKSHPSEVVVFMIKQEHSSESDSDFASAVYKKLEAHGLHNFYLHNRAPTLGEARGKIVIVRRFGKGSQGDFGMRFNWDDNTKGASFSSDGIDIYVEDHYKMLTVSYETKIEEIEDCLGKSHYEKNQKKFYLTFCSGEKDLSATLEYIASQINQRILSDFNTVNNKSLTRFGVVMLNFAGGADDNKVVKDLVKFIVNNNNPPGAARLISAHGIDYDADGMADPALAHENTWFIWVSGFDYSLLPPFELEFSGDAFATGDMDGDGLKDIAALIGSSWYVWTAADDYESSARQGPYDLGMTGKPFIGDFDGDGLGDPAVMNQDQLYMCLSSEQYMRRGPTAFMAGTPLASDLDRDGRADLILVVETLWTVFYSSRGYGEAQTFDFGVSGLPVTADFDGDGADDLAVYNTDNGWYVWFSTDAYQKCAGPYLG